MENRLLARFDAASQRRDLSTMAECAKILSQVNLNSMAKHLDLPSLLNVLNMYYHIYHLTPNVFVPKRKKDMASLSLS